MQLSLARSELELARREVELAAANLNVTNVRIAESRLQQARERAANAHAQLDYAVVRSPISGIVTEQAHQKGDYVAAGDKIVTVADVSQVVIKAQFPDTEVAGASQVVLGSDFPFDMGLDDPVSFVRGADLPAELTERILSGNAEALVQTRVRA